MHPRELYHCSQTAPLLPLARPEMMKHPPRKQQTQRELKSLLSHRQQQLQLQRQQRQELRG